MARKIDINVWRRIFAEVVELCRERARKGLEKFQDCMRRELRERARELRGG